MTGSGDESDVSSVSEVSSVHTSDLSDCDSHVDPVDQPAKKKARTAKKRHVDPSRLRPAKALDGSVAAISKGQLHFPKIEVGCVSLHSTCNCDGARAPQARVTAGGVRVILNWGWGGWCMVFGVAEKYAARLGVQERHFL